MGRSTEDHRNTVMKSCRQHHQRLRFFVVGGGPERMEAMKGVAVFVVR
jgi:hypothetical protein